MVAVAAEIATSVCLFATAHVILLLATDVSRTPPKAPYSYLLALMKLLALLFLGCAVLRWVAAFV